MFDIGWSELLLIGIVALIAIGPKELPGALRTLGQWMGKVRRMAAEFQGQFQEAMREAEIDQLKKDMDEMATKAKDYTRLDDPLDDVRRDVEKSMGELPSINQPSTASTTAASEPQSDEPTPPAETKPSADANASAALPPPAEQAAVTPSNTTPAASEPEPAVADAKPAAGRAPA